MKQLHNTIMKRLETPMEQVVFTLGQASIETGKSKPTISRDIKKGKLSAKKLENGSYEINASELFRVYPAVTPETVTKIENVTNDNPHGIPETVIELIQLREKVKSQAELIQEYKNQRDSWEEEAKGVRLALTDQSSHAGKRQISPVQWIKNIFTV